MITIQELTLSSNAKQVLKGLDKQERKALHDALRIFYYEAHSPEARRMAKEWGDKLMQLTLDKVNKSNEIEEDKTPAQVLWDKTKKTFTKK